MERKYIDQLIQWRDSPRRKPLMVWGARQVGKTYLIEDLFAKRYFKGKYLRIDCSADAAFVDYVYKTSNLEKLLEYISANYDFPVGSDTLLIFDEAQECLPIVSLMKQFCEKRRDIPVIVTGSLVRIKIKRETTKRGQYAKTKFLFPVGKINQLDVYPMGFDEFLMNMNPSMYESIRQAYSEKNGRDDLHESYLRAFNEYIRIGGMPEVVDTYIEEKRAGNPNAFLEAKNVLKDIYDEYLDDMELYQASPESVIRSKAIFQNIYGQLNKEAKNFKCSSIEKNAKTRDMIAPIDWLTTARVSIKSSMVKEKVTSPLVSSSESLFRMYLADIGMYTYQSGLFGQGLVGAITGEFTGYFYENYIATELSARGIKLFYWKGKRDAEFEFVIDIGGKIIPIDVKKGRGSLRSLEEFRTHNPKNLAIKISSSQYGFDKEKMIVNIPFYFVPFFFDDLLKGGLKELK